MKNYLEFEKDIKTLEDEMELLKSPGNESISEVDTSKIKSTQDCVTKISNKLFSNQQEDVLETFGISLKAL